MIQKTLTLNTSALLLFCLVLPADANVGEKIWDGVIIDRLPVYDAYPTHLFVDGSHHIWYCGASTIVNEDGIFYTTKTSPLSQSGGWSTPVEILNNTTIPWAEQHVCDPSVIRGNFNYDQDSYQYAMYFTGDDNSLPVGVRNGIGVAFSNDRLTWVAHPTRIILPEDPNAEEYGAGQSSVAWSPDNTSTLLQLYRDSTAAPGLDSEVFLTSTSDGVLYNPVPGIATLLPESGVDGRNAASPDIAYNTLDRHWYTVITTNGFGIDPPDFRVRLLRSTSPNTLLDSWEQLAEWDISDSGEETTIEPGLSRNENGSLYVDEMGWLYIFMTVGEWIPDFQTWAIAQARYRVISSSGKTISDNFTNMGPFRRDGQPLDGQWTEFGAREWNADNLLVFGTNADITVEANSSGQVASIPFVPSPSNRVSTVEARVDLTGSNWISIGFGSTGAGIFSGELFLLLHNLTGDVEVFADGTTNSLVQVPAPGLNAGWNDLILEHNPVGNTVSALCNGVRILDGFQLDNLNGGAGFVPNIQHAVFHLNDPDAGVSRIDDFAVSQKRYIFLGSFEIGDPSTWSTVCNDCPGD